MSQFDFNKKFNSDMDKSFDKAFGRAWYASLIGAVVIGVLNLALIVGVVWIAIHFLSKVW